ncbi:DUF4113 domain-containing protein [Cronobacter turicensis]
MNSTSRAGKRFICRAGHSAVMQMKRKMLLPCYTTRLDNVPLTQAC